MPHLTGAAITVFRGVAALRPPQGGSKSLLVFGGGLSIRKPCLDDALCPPLFSFEYPLVVRLELHE